MVGGERLTVGVFPLRDVDPRPRELAELLRGGRERRFGAGFEPVDAPREGRAAGVPVFSPAGSLCSAGGAEGYPFIGVAVIHVDRMVWGLLLKWRRGRSVELRIEEVEMEVDCRGGVSLRKGPGGDGM